MAAGEILDLTAFSNAMKVRGLFEKQTRQFLTQAFLLENIRRKSGSVKLGGRTMEIPLETRGMASFGAQQELEPISEPDVPGFALGQVTTKTLTSRFQISHQAHLSSKNNQAAWVGATMKNMSSTVEMFAMNFSRQLHGDGSGAVARVNGAPAAGPPISIVVDTDQSAGAGGTFGTKYLIRGMRLSASATKTGTTAEKTADLRILSVNDSTLTITCDGSLGDLADDDYLFVGSRDRTSKGRMPLGIQAAISTTGTYLNINRATAGNEYWQSQVSTTVAGADLENNIQTNCDEVMRKFGAKTDLIMMSLGVWRRFANDLRGDRRFVTAGETGKYKGGTSMLMYEGADGGPIPIVRDRDVPVGTMWGFEWKDWVLGELMPAMWIGGIGGERGSIFSRVADHLAWEACYGWMGELMCVKPGAQWLSSGITEA